MMQFISMLFDTVWRLYSIPWPGFPFTIGQAVIGVLCAIFGLKILTMLTGFSFSADTFHLPTPGEQRGGNNKNIKVSEKRRGDTR